METLATVAQDVMDKYYQDYASDEDFFQLDDFMGVVSSAFNKIANDEYDQNKLFNKQVNGYSVVDISDDWLTKEIATVTIDDFTGDLVAILSKKVWMPSFDLLGTGIQEVQIKNCPECIRIARTDTWKLRIIPVVKSIFFIAEKDKVRFKHTKGLKVNDKVRVSYVAAISSDDEDGIIPESKVFQIRAVALQLMIATRDGTVVDMTSNKNPNKNLQTEIDKNQLK